MLISRAVKIELDPTPKQAEAFARACGVARYVYNYVLGLRKIGYANAKSRGEKYKVPYMYGEVRKHRDADAKWIGEVPATSINYAIRGVDDGFKAFFASCKGGRAGRRVSPPRFKSRSRSRRSFRVQSQQRSPVRGRSIQVQSIGWIRVKEDPTTRIPEGARVVSICVSQDVDRWYASLCLQDVPHPDPLPREAKTVGVDLNVARAVCSDGTEYAVPVRLKVLARRQRRAQRVMSRRQKGSNRRQVAKVRVAKIQRSARRVRENWLHKVTTDLVRKNTRIVIEDLNVQGMTRSARGTIEAPGKNVRAKAGLNRAILRAGFGEFRRQLTYKGQWHGTEIVVADRWFASSKTCSCCGAKNENLTLADRVFRCGTCGLEIDRDLNASINLEKVPSVATPSEVPAGCGELTDVDRTKPVRSERRKPESVTRATGQKRQRNTHPRSESEKASEATHARKSDDPPLQRNRAGPPGSKALRINLLARSEWPSERIGDA